jgi:serine/threonine-protein phosphatase 2A regulatory subunit A
VIEASILPMMDKLFNDYIPNIRFNVAKSYGVLVNTLKQLPEEGTVIALEKAGTPGQGCAKATDLITKSILPNLEKLQQDDDVDVRYFASTAAQSFTDAMQS